jgi:endonuclease/exonuclease/phosphatase family metal-dependent hydrolase
VSADRLRVATYNVRYSGVDEGRLAWEHRRGPVAATVRAHRPDALALQECWMGQLEDLRGRLPGYDWVAHPDDVGAHTPIGVRADRLAVEDSGAFGLAPGGERGVLGWDAALPRTVTVASLRDRRTDRRLTLASVHLDHRGPEARLEGARLVLERLPAGPAVVAGDCNCEPGSEPYRALTAELTDARAATARRAGPAETYVGFGGAGTGESAGDTPEPKRIDYLFVRGVAVDSYRTVSAGEAVPPSDHRLVLADLVPLG